MIQKLFLFGVLVFFVACSDENPLDVVEDELDHARYEAQSAAYEDYSEASSASEATKCYYGLSTYSDSYCCAYYGYRCYVSSSSSYRSSSSAINEATKCALGISTYSNSYCCTYYGYRCSYVSSSSSYQSSSSFRSSSSATVEIQNAHLTVAKKMNFTLTYYKQVTSGWDLGGISDGDPSISFTVYFIATGGQSTSVGTGTLLSLQDQGSWSGSTNKTISVPVSTKDIEVCPSVVDKDLLSNDNMSSGYCYTITNVGYLSNYKVVEQSDYNASKYKLEWEWYLY